jgi:hypothetical protein
MKRIFILLLACISITACRQHTNAWTKEYTQKTYNELYEGIGTVIKDSAQRRQVTAYMIKRFKAELPYGLESVSADSLRKLSVKIGGDYTAIHNNGNLQATIKWTPESELSLKEGFARYLKSYTPKNRDKMCDCLVVKLKQIYPDSLTTPVPDSVYVKIVKECK